MERPRLARTAGLAGLAALAVAGVVSALVGASGDDVRAAGTTTHGLRPTPVVSTVIDPLPVDPATLAIGDLRRLPPPPQGLLGGVLTYADLTCDRHDVVLATGADDHGATLPGCSLTASPDGRFLLVQPAEADRTPGPSTRLDLVGGHGVEASAAAGPEGTGPAVVGDDGRTLTCSLAGPLWSSPPRPAAIVPGRCGQVAVDGTVVHLDRHGRALLSEPGGRVVRRLPWRLGDLPVVAAVPDGSALVGTDFDPARHRLRLRFADRAGRPIGVAVHLPTTFHVRELHLARRAESFAVRGEGGWLLQRTGTAGIVAVTAIGPSSIVDVDVSPDGRWFAVATREGVALVDARTLAPRYAIAADAASVVWRP